MIPHSGRRLAHDKETATYQEETTIEVRAQVSETGKEERFYPARPGFRQQGTD
jgi:hypothetical protein